MKLQSGVTARRTVEEASLSSTRARWPELPVAVAIQWDDGAITVKYLWSGWAQEEGPWSLPSIRRHLLSVWSCLGRVGAVSRALQRRGYCACCGSRRARDPWGSFQRALLLIFLLPRYPRVDQAAAKDESSAPAPAAGAQPTADRPGAARRRRLTTLGAAMTRRGRRSVGTSDARTGASTAHHLWHPKAPTHQRPCPKSAAGRSRRKVQPSPGTVSSSRRPPWPWAMAAAMARPRPLPPWLRERAGSAR